MSADHALQLAIRAALIASPGVLTLVPASAILDRSKRPVPKPSIILGESQVVDEGESLHRKRLRLYHTLHIWTKEPGLAGAKGIMGQVRLALASRPALAGPYHCADLWVAVERAMRDLDGETGHGVITLEAIVGWS